MKMVGHARPRLPHAAILTCLALGVGCEDKEARKDFLEISYRVLSPIRQLKELNSKGAVKQFTNKEPLMGVVDTMQICHEMGEPAKRLASVKSDDLKTPAAKSLLASVKVNAQSLVEASEVCLLNATDCAPKCDSALSDLTTSVAALSAAAKGHEIEIGTIR